MNKLIRVKKIILALSGKLPARRSLTTLDDDVFIVSYPKSGNTWTRFLIGNLVYGESGKVDFKNIERLVPDIYQNSDKQLLKVRSPRYLKSHEYFDPRYNRVIFIVRDPRDILVSYYYFCLKVGSIPSSTSIEEFSVKFIDGRINLFGSWAQNISSWVHAKKEGLLLLKYEDMVADAESSVWAISEFLGLKCSQEHVSKAVRMSSFSRMKQLEAQQSDNWKPLKGTRKDIPFMRSGSSGGWKELLSEEVIDRMEKKWGPEMRFMGYE